MAAPEAGAKKRTAAPLLAFGAASAFLSSPGQTFFIAVFIPFFGVAFGVSAGELGALYMGATLGAACLLPLVGPWIDRLDLKLFTSLTLAALALACAVTAMAAGPLGLFAGFLLLRLTGQGLMSHIAVTSVSRYFAARRGRALAVVAMGFPLAEAVAPGAALALISAAGWREAYAIVAAVIVVAAAPALIALVRGRPDFTRPPAGADAAREPRPVRAAARILARSPYFWLALPVLLYLPLTSTALIFHIQALAALKGWSRELVALAFVGYALGHVGGIALSGELVDRLTAKRILPIMNAPLLAGLCVLALFNQPATLFAFLALLGITAGLTQTSVGAMWAEVYGVERLGAIRSLAVMLMVAGTALGPALIGAALDREAGVAAIALALAAAGAGAGALAFIGARRELSKGAGAQY